MHRLRLLNDPPLHGASAAHKRSDVSTGTATAAGGGAAAADAPAAAAFRLVGQPDDDSVVQACQLFPDGSVFGKAVTAAYVSFQ